MFASLLDAKFQRQAAILPPDRSALKKPAALEVS
jgi:hypothetical protein